MKKRFSVEQSERFKDWRVEMGRRQFSREFKLEVVRLVKERGVSVVQASRDLDVGHRRLPSSRADRCPYWMLFWSTCSNSLGLSL